MLSSWPLSCGFTSVLIVYNVYYGRGVNSQHQSEMKALTCSSLLVSGQCLGLLLGGTIFVRVYCTAGISAHQVNIIITSPFVLVCGVFSATD